jgi:hypothetical protein
MVRGKKPLRPGVPKSVSSRIDCKCVYEPPSASWACSAHYLARGGRRGQAPGAAHVYLPGMGQGDVHGRRWLQIPWILRNCPTFRAAPRIRVSLDTRRVKFASVIMSEEGESVESADVVERRRSSEAAP